MFKLRQRPPTSFIPQFGLVPVPTAPRWATTPPQTSAGNGTIPRQRNGGTIRPSPFPTLSIEKAAAAASRTRNVAATPAKQPPQRRVPQPHEEMSAPSSGARSQSAFVRWLNELRAPKTAMVEKRKPRPASWTGSLPRNFATQLAQPIPTMKTSTLPRSPPILKNARRDEASAALRRAPPPLSLSPSTRLRQGDKFDGLYDNAPANGYAASSSAASAQSISRRSLPRCEPPVVDSERAFSTLPRSFISPPPPTIIINAAAT